MKLLLIAILLFLIITLIYSYIFVKRILKLIKFNLKKDWWKLIIFIILLIILLKVTNITSILFIIIMHLLLYTFITDIIYKIINLIKDNNIIKTIQKYLVIPAILTIATITYGYINFYNIVETNYEIITNKNISQNTTILYISDSHYGGLLKKENIASLKKDLDKINADVILLGGDIIDERTTKEDMQFILNYLGSLKNKNGIYFIQGNHDRQLYSSNKLYTDQELNDSLEKNNIISLVDENITLDNNITIIGRNNADLKRESVDKLIAEINKENFIIMLDHQPIEYKELINNKVDLTISGHTHAGQIFPAEQVINVFNTADLAYGYKKIDNSNFIVSSGLSGWGFPIRTARHSEYVVIKIKQE